MPSEVTINKDLKLNLDILRPLTYVVSEEEEIVIRDINNYIKHKSDVFVYRSTSGLQSYEDYEAEVKENTDKRGKEVQINDALNKIYSSSSHDKCLTYIMLDIDVYLEGSGSTPNVVRRLKDIVIQTYKDSSSLKSIIIVSSNLVVPLKLQRYIDVIYYEMPSDKAIREKAQSVLKEYNSTIEKKTDKIDTTINESNIKNFKGLTLFEIEQTVLSSVKSHRKLDNEVINFYKNSILKKTSLLEPMEVDVSFDDVGGMDPLKQWLEVRKGMGTQEALDAKVPDLKGLLLIGITGCGKSLISKAIAKQWGLPLVNFNPSKIFSSRVGESENNMMKALKIVEGISPCIMLVDEIEKQFAGSQSSTFSDAGTTARVIGTFLTWYNDNKYPIFLVATCNSIEYLPPELVSRFDDKFFVNLPSFNERKAIFDIQLRKYGRDWKNTKISLQNLAEASENLTGREIEQVVKSSIHEMFYEKRISKDKKLDLEEKHLIKVLDEKVPVLQTMRDQIELLVKWVGWDEEKRNGIRAIYANKKEEGDDIDQLMSDILSKVDEKGKDTDLPEKTT